MNFWDTSALLPLYIQEKTTAVVKKIKEELSSDELVLSVLTPVEFFSALCRMYREGKMTREVLNESFERFSLLVEFSQVVGDIDAISAQALRALRIHPLRSADALQLAAALLASLGTPSLHTFVTFDSKLAEAAAKEGFRVLP